MDIAKINYLQSKRNEFLEKFKRCRKGRLNHKNVNKLCECIKEMFREHLMASPQANIMNWENFYAYNSANCVLSKLHQEADEVTLPIFYRFYKIKKTIEIKKLRMLKGHLHMIKVIVKRQFKSGTSLKKAIQKQLEQPRRETDDGRKTEQPKSVTDLIINETTFPPSAIEEITVQTENAPQSATVMNVAESDILTFVQTTAQIILPEANTGTLQIPMDEAMELATHHRLLEGAPQPGVIVSPKNTDASSSVQPTTQINEMRTASTQISVERIVGLTSHDERIVGRGLSSILEHMMESDVSLAVIQMAMARSNKTSVPFQSSVGENMLAPVLPLLMTNDGSTAAAQMQMENHVSLPAESLSSITVRESNTRPHCPIVDQISLFPEQFFGDKTDDPVHSIQLPIEQNNSSAPPHLSVNEHNGKPAVVQLPLTVGNETPVEIVDKTVASSNMTSVNGKENKRPVIDDTTILPSYAKRAIRLNALNQSRKVLPFRKVIIHSPDEFTEPSYRIEPLKFPTVIKELDILWRRFAFTMPMKHPRTSQLPETQINRAHGPMNSPYFTANEIPGSVSKPQQETLVDNLNLESIGMQIDATTEETLTRCPEANANIQIANLTTFDPSIPIAESTRVEIPVTPSCSERQSSSKELKKISLQNDTPFCCDSAGSATVRSENIWRNKSFVFGRFTELWSSYEEISWTMILGKDFSLQNKIRLINTTLKLNAENRTQIIEKENKIWGVAPYSSAFP